MKRIVTFGEIMMRLTPPGHGRFVQATDLQVTYGGAEANVAVSLACLGLHATYVTRLPNSPVGDAALNELRRYGVDTNHILRGGSRLGLYFMERGADRRPSHVVYDRADSAIAMTAPGDFDWDAILDQADMLHLTGITPALSENTLNASLDALRTAKAHGVTVSFDPNYRAALWSIDRASTIVQEIMPYVDILITNENQATHLLDVAVPESERQGNDVTDAGYLAMSQVLYTRYRLKFVALTERRTFGAEDNSFCAKLYDGNSLYTSTKYRMDIVDRVGGGDAFAAGLLYALAESMSPTETVSFAAAAACLKHSVEGDFNLVSKEEIQSLAQGQTRGQVKR